MEVAPCEPKAGSHAASLLASLNVQRGQAQFCDCVIRQRQTPDQLYLAHRCVLAASSPVLASILSSTGALVELQDPCLSDSALRLILDYIYGGALPYTHYSQQQYSNLLTAACYLQMDELKETLRTKVNTADYTNFSTGPANQPPKDINNTYSEAVTQYLQSSETYSVNSPEREDQYWDDSNTCGSSDENGTSKCIRDSASPLSHVSTSGSLPESAGSSVNTDDRQSIPCMAGMNKMSREDKEVQDDQLYSAGTVKPESSHSSTKGAQVRTVMSGRGLTLLHCAEVQEEQTCRAERTQSNQSEPNREVERKTHHSLHPRLSSSHPKVHGSPLQCPSQSSSPPQRCCGAVPVIRHSSAASAADVSSVPLYRPVSKPPGNSGTAADSRSGSRANNGIVEGITNKQKHIDGAQDQDSRNNKKHRGMQTLQFCKEVGPFANPRPGSMRETSDTTDQVLLLDISNTPAELLVSYRRWSDDLERGVASDQQDTSGNELGDSDREEQDGAALSAGQEKRQTGAGTRCVAERFNEAEAKLWVGETNAEGRKSIVGVQSSPRAEVIHKSWGLGCGDQTTTLTRCASPSMPDSLQSAVASTLPVCIQSNLTASMPRNISSHLSSPVHDPIQCSLCSRSFSQRGSLNRHMRSHLGVRPFPCPRCQMTFSRQYRVIEHMRVHQRCVLGSDFQKPPSSMM